VGNIRRKLRSLDLDDDYFLNALMVAGLPIDLNRKPDRRMKQLMDLGAIVERIKLYAGDLIDYIVQIYAVLFVKYPPEGQMHGKLVEYEVCEEIGKLIADEMNDFGMEKGFGEEPYHAFCDVLPDVIAWAQS
jgi:hypothetical protein